MKTFLKIVTCFLLWVPMQASAVEKISVSLTEELQRKITNLSVIEGESLGTNSLKKPSGFNLFFCKLVSPLQHRV
jgi:hypothetical protein